MDSDDTDDDTDDHTDDDNSDEIEDDTNGGSDDETEIKIVKSKRAEIKTEKEAKDLLKIIMKSTFRLSGTSERDSLRQPSAPFTTSTLQQEAARKLGFTVKRTMSAAQILYETGKITYMRTDSVGLSKEALKNIEKFVIHEYGKEYHRQIEYTTKKKNTQEAHEAVRPTDVNVKGLGIEGKIGNDEMRLYSLIWKRAVASQMTPAKFKIKNVQIDISKTSEYIYTTQIETPVFPGFLAVYNLANLEKEDEEEKTQMIELPKIGSKIEIQNTSAIQEYEKPAPRYNEASLVSKMDPKNLNIGRPATYGAIITKIQDRKYVEKKDIEGIQKESKTLLWISGNTTIKESVKKISIGKETGKLVPTSMGTIVTDFLIEHFTEIMDYQFTSTMEDQLDEVEEGERVWYKLLDEFYKKFHKIVEKLSKQQLKILDKDRKVLGKDEKSGKDIVATTKKYGPVVLIDNGDKKALNIAPIKPPLTIESITLEDAIKLLEYPKSLGKYGGKQIKLYTGKYGLYVKHGDNNYSLKDVEDFDEDVDESDMLEKIIEIIENKKETSGVLWEKKDGKITYKILNGQYGRYINIKDSSKKTSKGTNVKFPKESESEDDIKDMTIEKLKTVIEKNKTNGFKKGGFKKGIFKKTSDSNDSEKKEIPKATKKTPKKT
jgi:DNA topoisomerase-1